jgi:hypothetical protein
MSLGACVVPWRWISEQRQRDAGGRNPQAGLRTQSQQNPGGNQGMHHACWAARAALLHVYDCGETAHRLLLTDASTCWL